MFKCVRSQICLHIGDVCDGHYDCPWKDDELMCKLVGTKCPEKCQCLNFGISCRNVSFDIRALSTLPHISVHVTNCNIKSIPNLDLDHDIIILNLSKNSITNICAQKFMTSLTIIDLSYNMIMFITKGYFDSLGKLMILMLQNNKIEQMAYKGFHNLTKVLTVDLSNNKLSTLAKQAFANITQISLLILHSILFKDLFVTMFKGLDIKLVITDNYQIYCLAPDEVDNCISKNFIHAACQMYSLESVMVAATVYAVIITLLNIISINLNTRQTGGPVKIIVNAHGVVNILYSFYLIIMLAMNTYYEENLLIHESQWRNSIFCIVAFVIILNFYFVSMFWALFLSFGRLMVVLYPLYSKFRVKSIVSERLLFGVCTLGFFSLSVGFIMKLTNWKTPSIFCLPFIDPHYSSLGIILFTTVFLFIKSSAIVRMTVMYTNMIQNIKKSNENMQIFNQRRIFPVVIRVIILIISNFITAIVPTVIYLVCLLLKYYPKDTLAWITVTIVPIKCIIDPIIFILVAPRKDRNKHKIIQKDNSCSQTVI